MSISKAVLLQHANRKTVGKRYENLALSYLLQAGLTFIAENIRYSAGEIDLIMQDGHTLVFIEVRFRRSAAFGGAIPSITRAKRQRLLRAASHWLMERDLSLDNTDCRFDVFAITGNQVEWLPNAFNEDNIYY